MGKPSNNWGKEMLKKLFPNGIWIFVFLAIISNIINKAVNLVWSASLGYIFITLYFIFLISISAIEKIHVFVFSKVLQWLTLFVLPLIGSFSAFYIIKVFKNPTDDFFPLFVDNNYSIVFTSIFFSTAVLMWSILSINQEQSMNKHEYFSYAVTCIPISKKTDKDKFVVCLIENKSHSTASWMFPGGHFDITKNYYNPNHLSLKDIDRIPETIIQQKVVKEAGILDLSLLSIEDKYKTVFEDRDTGKSVKSPAFNHLLKVSQDANCYKIHNHRVHYDFTYIGCYSDSSGKGKYNRLEVDFDKECFTGKKNDCLSKISTELCDQINKHKNTDARLNAAVLFPDSIPEMIYNARKYYFFCVK